MNSMRSRWAQAHDGLTWEEDAHCCNFVTWPPCSTPKAITPQDTLWRWRNLQVCLCFRQQIPFPAQHRSAASSWHQKKAEKKYLSLARLLSNPKSSTWCQTPLKQRSPRVCSIWTCCTMTGWSESTEVTDKGIKEQTVLLSTDLDTALETNILHSHFHKNTVLFKHYRKSYLR